MTTKLPTSDRPLIRDVDLANALETILAPYSGKRLEKAQQALKKVRASGVQGPFSTVISAYRAAIEKAAGED